MTFIITTILHFQVVCNYFGVNGSFQMLPAFNSERFTLRGRHTVPHTELPDKSCKLSLLLFSLSQTNRQHTPVYVFD